MSAQMGQAIGQKILTTGLDAMLPGAGQVLNKVGVFSSKAPRPVQQISGRPDVSQLKKIVSLRQEVPKDRTARMAYFDDGSTQVIKGVYIDASRLGNSTNYYDPNTGGIIAIPNPGEINFDGIDPRTGRNPPGRYGMAYTPDGQMYEFADGGQGGASSAPATTGKPQALSAPDRSNNPMFRSPVTGNRLGDVNLPMISYKPIKGVQNDRQY